MSIIYFIDNKLGGITSLNYNLANNINDKSISQIVIHINSDQREMTKADLSFPVQREITFNYSIKDNYYNTLKELRKLVPEEEGAMILNYDTEMAMLDHYPVKQTTYQIVHDSYNLKLAKKYGYLVDIFICHNTFIFENLLNLFPSRIHDIFNLPHGVPIPAKFTEIDCQMTPLRLIFLGRIASSKGIYDLPIISDILTREGVEFQWTLVGDGPELEQLKSKWNNIGRITYVSPKTNAEVLKICACNDVFVLPTKFEGSPVALLETMSVGLVPVISNLPGGISDIVSEDIGFKILVDDNIGFAKAIVMLYKDRGLLKRMSRNCRNKIIMDFDIKKTSTNYLNLFLRYKEFFKMKEIRNTKVGSSLDQRVIPNKITRTLRNIIRRN